MTTIYDFSLAGLNGEAMPLAQYEGDVLLLVNVASQCGLTPQYSGLEALQKQYSTRGFKVLGLPCNQFGGQEPGTANEIATFCETKFQVTFPMSEKIDVNGEGRHPLYEYLVGEEAAFSGDITWNFEKFLIDKRGGVIRRFDPTTAPDAQELVEAIEEALEA